MICLCTLLSGCSPTQWQTSEINTANIQGSLILFDYDGEIPEALSDWEIIADISDQWYPCNHGFILNHTKMSIDEENRIWIFGPDSWNGPIGGIPDNPGCSTNFTSRMIVLDPDTGSASSVIFNDQPGLQLTTFSNWHHIDQDKILLSSALFMTGNWDSEEGAGNRFVDLAIIDNGEIKPLLAESTSFWAVPDFTISGNMVYAVVRDSQSEIQVYDLKSEELINIFPLDKCKTPQWIEINQDHLFLICERENDFLPKMYTIDFDLIDSWSLIANHINDLKMSSNSQGKIWLGYDYILREENDNWVLDRILPDEDLLSNSEYSNFQKTIFGMLSYQDDMFFSVDGGMYLANYEQKQWKKILHGASPMPVAIGPDGRIYAFTGKYIISSKP